MDKTPKSQGKSLTERKFLKRYENYSAEYFSASEEEVALPSRVSKRGRSKTPFRKPQNNQSKSYRKKLDFNSPLIPRPSRSRSVGSALTALTEQSSGDSRDYKCHLILRIINIFGLETVSSKQDFFTVSAKFKEEVVKSHQIHRDRIGKISFTEHLIFQWDISTVDAKQFLEEPYKIRLDTTLKMEKAATKPGKPWTSIVGNTTIPEKNIQPDSI